MPLTRGAAAKNRSMDIGGTSSESDDESVCDPQQHDEALLVPPAALHAYNTPSANTTPPLRNMSYAQVEDLITEVVFKEQVDFVAHYLRLDKADRGRLSPTLAAYLSNVFIDATVTVVDNLWKRGMLKKDK